MNRLTFAAAWLLLICVISPAPAATDTPVHVTITKALTPLTDVLASLSKQSDVPILADDTVVDTLDTSSIAKPSLEAMLTSLTKLVPGLTWQRVYLAQGASLPDANALSAQARALKAIAASGLVIADPAAQSTLTFSKASAADAAAPAGMRLVYLVTNETVRAQRAAKKPDEAKPAPVAQAVTGLQNVADEFGNMTADQQREALPQMFLQMQRMMQSLDPGVRDQIRQQMRQGRQGRQNGGNGGTGF